MNTAELIPWLALGFLLAATIGSFLCGLWILTIAFGEGALHGLGCLLCGPYGLYYCISRWHQCKTPFLVILGLNIACVALQFQVEGSPMEQISASVQELKQVQQESAAERLKRDLQNLQGKWVLSVKQTNQPAPQYEMFEFDGQQCTISGAGAAHQFHVNLTRSVFGRAIDLLGEERTLRGIYVVQGDQLTICFAGPGKPRPDRFTDWGDRQRTFVLRRDHSVATAPSGPSSTETNSMAPTPSSKQNT